MAANSASDGRDSTPGTGAAEPEPARNTAPDSNSARSSLPREVLRCTAANNPGSSEVLGWEAAFVGHAEYLRPAGQEPGPEGSSTEVPASFTLQSLRQEAGIGLIITPFLSFGEFNNRRLS